MTKVNLDRGRGRTPTPAERALEVRERLLRDAQALAGLGSWEWDVVTDEVTWSDQLYHIFGLERDSFGGTLGAYLERVHPEDRERARAVVERAYRTGTSFEFEERIVRPDGTVRQLRSRGRIQRDETGAVTRMLGACLDITELRRAEERAVQFAREQAARESAEAAAVENARLLRQLEDRNRQLEAQSNELALQAELVRIQAAQREQLLAELEIANAELKRRTLEAEQANRAKSDFLAAMSHELRTPLNAILGYTDLLQLGLYGPVTEAQQEALERIKRNKHLLLSLVNDVLNFAKVEAGRLEITISDVGVADLIADLEKLIEPQLRAKGLDYRCRPPDLGLHVRGERERIEQILLNLLANAVKFTDPPGRIVLSVADGDRTAAIVVSDTGRGIPPDQIESIFDPFVQIDRNRDASADRGVGLGLAISQHLAHAMGGALTVASAVGEGSTFTLTLDRSQAR